MRQLEEVGVSTEGIGPAVGSVYDLVGRWFVGVLCSVKWKTTTQATVRT